MADKNNLLKELAEDLSTINRRQAEKILIRETGLTLTNLPDGLPLENFIDQDGNLDYNAISAW